MIIPGVGEEALTFIEPGQMVGEMALIDDEPRSADVTAHQGPAEVYVLSRDVFRRLLTTDDAKGAPLLAGVTMNLCPRAEEALRRVVAFRVMAGPFV
jgi:CRP-like cAMP-binding protein